MRAPPVRRNNKTRRGRARTAFMKPLSLLPKYLLIVFAVVTGIFLKWLSVPLIFLFYIVISLAFKNKTT
jgi:hypothetical protein